MRTSKGGQAEAFQLAGSNGQSGHFSRHLIGQFVLSLQATQGIDHGLTAGQFSTGNVSLKLTAT